MIVDYTNSKFPPAPILKIRLSAPLLSPQTESIPALIDTGSDYSLVPMSWLQEIDAPESRTAWVRGLWSPRHKATLYLVDLHLDKGVLPDIEVVGVEEQEGDFESSEIVLGRNVLNMLYLLLEGPNRQSRVLERRPLRF